MQDEEFACNIPTTQHPSKPDSPPPKCQVVAVSSELQGTLQVGVDGTVQESVLPTQWCTFSQVLLEVVTEEEEKKDQGDVGGKFVAFSFTLD